MEILTSLAGSVTASEFIETALLAKFALQDNLVWRNEHRQATSQNSHREGASLSGSSGMRNSRHKALSTERTRNIRLSRGIHVAGQLVVAERGLSRPNCFRNSHRKT